MKILLVNSLYPPYVVGGAERSLQFLAESLVMSGHSLVVATSQPKGPAQIDYLNGVTIYRIPVKNIYRPFGDRFPPWYKPLWHAIDSFNPLMAHEVSRVIDRERPDVVHTNNLAGFSTAVWVAIKKRDLPIIHTLRDTYLLCPRSTMFKHGRNCVRQCAICLILTIPRIRLTKLVDAVVGISRHLLDRHQSFGAFFNSHTKQIIHNSYQPLSISPPSEIKTDRRLTFGYLGRLEPAKGIEALLIAFQRLAAPNARLLIAGRGDGRYENELRSRFDSKNIKFLGFCSPHDFFRQVDILVTPSLLHEGLGRTIIEAYAHGVPVIGSNRGGIPEIIEDGKTGFIFDPDHLETLIIQMRKVIDGLFDLSEMAQQARIKAEEFHPDRIADAYLKLYTQVCRGRSVLAA